MMCENMTGELIDYRRKTVLLYERYTGKYVIIS